jgi:quercetin dioxygenase-like cupin family protein
MRRRNVHFTPAAALFDCLLSMVRAADLAAYAPANHTGTSNVRVIEPETVGATALEVLAGTIVKSQGGKTHAHPHLEQCAYMIEGTGESQAEGHVDVVGPGACSYMPAGAFQGRLSEYAVPEPDRIAFVSDIPKTGVGKIEKKALREHSAWA